MSIDTASSLTAPRPAHRLDEARLLDYLRAAVPQVVGSSATPQLLVQQFGHGQSNPTYLVTLNGHYRLVLRKKPPGKVLASAHAVDREYRVLQALSATATAGGVNGGARVPVPRPVALCDDASVLGTPFYLMEFADGRVFVDPNLPGCSAAQRGTVYSQMAATLAALHAVDPAAVGLDDYGAPSGYCARQLRRWEAQYAASVDGRPLPEMMHLLAWLKDHVPAADRHGGGGGGPSSSTCLVHGDYRLDNLVFDPRQLRVIAGE